MNFIRQTVKSPVTLEGIGLHSAVPVTLTVHPGENGIAFRYASDRVAAIPENVSETTRCTKLGSISTIEHLMSAFAGLEITDAEVELSQPELPGLDGSAHPFVLALQEVGFENVGEAELPNLFRRIFDQDGSAKLAISNGHGHWRYEYRAENRWPNEQIAEQLSLPERYPSEIAPARTFANLEDVPGILSQGLGLGLDEHSVLILGPDAYRNEARFPDEPARHKLLDLVGDLYLSGVPIRFLNVVAERSGHRMNVRAAAMLRQALENKD